MGTEVCDLKITEIFKSIEGEGIRTGRICTFIRSFGCPLRCTFCDSMYSNEKEPDQIILDLSVEEIVQECKKLKTPYVTFTGGEPLIQKDANELIERLLEEGFFVNIETSGACDISAVHEYLASKKKHPLMDNLIFTVDYKSYTSKCTGLMIMDNFLKHVRSTDVVKFVVGTKQDLDQMKHIVELIQDAKKEFQPHFFVSPVFGMIEMTDIIDYLKDNDLFDIQFQIQLHKVVWDPNRRGV